MHKSRVGGQDTPLKDYKAIGFFSNTGPDPLKTRKTDKPAFNVWHIMVIFWWLLDPLSPLKKIVGDCIGAHLAKLSESGQA